MFGKASESCDVYSFGVLLLELASGKRPIENLSPTQKLAISDWALPLAREGRFSEIADPKLNGNYVEEELKRLVLVGLVCTQSKPERRPTMLEVVGLLKGESKEKVSSLESDEMFRLEPTVCSQKTSGLDDSSDCMSKDTGVDVKQEIDSLAETALPVR
ncbi:PTI1-like tyrosine-protein kinase [Ananas comosus]|nr:PTI1-like tyrosine-protein kinase [Ananas comosus]